MPQRYSEARLLMSERLKVELTLTAAAAVKAACTSRSDAEKLPWEELAAFWPERTIIKKDLESRYLASVAGSSPA
eukprot:5499606-Lingulodinium_polyedra.AAC.1